LTANVDECIFSSRKKTDMYRTYRCVLFI